MRKFSNKNPTNILFHTCFLPLSIKLGFSGNLPHRNWMKPANWISAIFNQSLLNYIGKTAHNSIFTNIKKNIHIIWFVNSKVPHVQKYYFSQKVQPAQQLNAFEYWRCVFDKILKQIQINLLNYAWIKFAHKLMQLISGKKNISNFN